MKSNSLILSALFIFCIISCQNKSVKKFEKLEKMNWLVGQWENSMPNGLLTETWKKENDSTFSGKSYFIINKKDTIHSETIILKQIKDDLIYSPTVKGQNNDKAVIFKLTTATTKEFTFENPTHDYPKKIVYKMVNATNLVATISGIQQGKPSSESYPMKKK